MRTIIVFCLVGACLGLPHPQGPQQYNQVYQDPSPAYQDDLRQYGPKIENYREEILEPDYDTNENTIPGEPGKDYPVHAFIPRTSFSCSDRLPGFYADGEAGCQVWHYCKTDGLVDSFLCPNGTIYNQANRVCEWWFNVNCDPETLNKQAMVNEDLYIIPPKKEEYVPAPENQYSRPPRPQHSREPPPQYQSAPQYSPAPSQFVSESQYVPEFQYAPEPQYQQDYEDTQGYQQDHQAF